MNADERRFAVLRAIVADYVSTQEPVGSKMIVERHNLGVSSATVRNDMAVLEEDGPGDWVRFERLEGRPLPIDRHEGELFFRLGSELRAFQDSRHGAGAGPLAQHGPSAELALLDRLATRYRALEGDPPPRWDATREELAKRARQLEGLELRPCHRDLHDGQLLVQGDGIALLDLDLLCRADATLDPANFLAHLALRELQGVPGVDEESVLACGQAFLEGLDRADATGFWRRLRYHQAASFLRLALVYGLRPRWSRLAPSLVDLAGRCLRQRHGD